MPVTSNRRHFVVAFAAAFVIAGVTESLGCPFCQGGMGQSLREKAADADLVVFAVLSKASLDRNTTEMRVERVLKGHPILEGGSDFTLSQYVAPAETEDVDYVVFAEVVDGRIDPYEGMPVTEDGKEFVDYVAGAIAVDKGDATDRLTYFFAYLQNGDDVIATDAYKEFSVMPYVEVAAAADAYDPERIVGWIRDPETTSYKIGLYGLLLGLCDRPGDAELLREFSESENLRPLTGVDGILGGYCVLEPEAGAKLVLDMLADPDEEFSVRYAALRTARFLLDELDVDEDAVFEGLARSLESPDIADLIIDEFRKREHWSNAGKILGLYERKPFDTRIVRKSVLRYALKCPDSRARDFVLEMRKTNPIMVSDAEAILEFEERARRSFPPSDTNPDAQ